MSKSSFGSPLALLGAGALLVASLPFVQACIDETPATTNTGGASTGGASTGGASTGGASGSDSGGTTATGGSVAGGGMTGGTETGGSSGSDVGGAGAGGLAGAAGTVAGGGAGGFAGSSGDAGAGGKAGAGGSLGGMSGSGGIGGASGGAGGKAGGGGSGGMIAIGGSGSYVRTGWTAEYTCTGGDCPPKSAADMGNVATRAFDNSFTTRWSTGVYQSALATQNRFPLYFTVNMKQVTNVSRITTHPGCQDIFDSPGTVEVYLSLDGANFGTAVTTMPHVPAVPPNEPCPPSATAVATDSITFPTTPARFIQLKATRRTTSDRYWAIGELNVYP